MRSRICAYCTSAPGVLKACRSRFCLAASLLLLLPRGPRTDHGSRPLLVQLLHVSLSLYVNSRCPPHMRQPIRRCIPSCRSAVHHSGRCCIPIRLPYEPSMPRPQRCCIRCSVYLPAQVHLSHGPEDSGTLPIQDCSEDCRAAAVRQRFALEHLHASGSVFSLRAWVAHAL
jgi:hypothetical protein